MEEAERPGRNVTARAVLCTAAKKTGNSKRVKRFVVYALAVLAILLVVGGVLFWYAEWIFVPAPAPVDVRVGPVELLPPGTIISDSAPYGWTHLILKSRPVIASGDVERLGPVETRYATFLFMTTVARVAPHKSRFRTTYVLDAVALGLGTTVDGADMVLSPDTQKELGANLGLVFKLILRGAYNKQQEVHLVARSPTFALLDTPALMLRRGHHEDVTFRYAILVDGPTGRLDTLVWLLDRTAPDEPAPGPMEWLPPGKQEQAPLHVDGSEFKLLGQPGPRAFAVERVPQGERHLSIPADLKGLAAQEQFTSDEAGQLDQALRRLLRSANK
jgi:hypothetical protein